MDPSESGAVDHDGSPDAKSYVGLRRLCSDGAPISLLSKDKTTYRVSHEIRDLDAQNK